MDALTIIVAALSAIGSIVSAGVAIYIARLTAKTITAYEQQVQIGQDQVKAAHEQTCNQARPILIPPTNIDGIVKINQGTKFVEWGQVQVKIDGLQNIGVGSAFNIYGVFFGKPVANLPPRDRYSIWNYGFLPPGETGKEITVTQASSLSSESTIGGHTLYIPDDPQHNGRLVRLVLTYQDIFGRKLASIYDYQNVIGWMLLGHFEDIELDIHDLDNLDPMTQQSNQFFYNLGKTHI